MNIKVTKDGKWHDKPYQNQFNVDAGEVIEVSNETQVLNNRAVCVSSEMATIMVDSGNAEMMVKPVKETKPVKTQKETKPLNNTKVEKKA